MKLFNTITCAFIAFCLISLQTSCKKENDNFADYPISLSVKDTLGTTKLTWTKIESSDFIEYVVVRSNKDSIRDFSNLNTTGGAVIISRISNVKQTDFLDFSGTNFAVKFYYRVFARMKNRTLSSPNYQYNSDLSVLNIAQPSEIIQDVSNPNLVYLNSLSSNQIILYDLLKDSIIAKSTSTFGSSRIILASDKGNNAELIQYNSQRVYFFDAKTLELKTSVNFAYNIYNISGSQDGFIYMYVDESNKQLQILRLSDHKVISTLSSYINNNYFYSAFLNKIPNTNSVLVIENNSSNPNVAKILHDPQGNFVSSQYLGRIINNSSFSQLMRISSKGAYFFFNSLVFAEPLDITKPLNLVLQNFSDFAFKEDETKCYIVRQIFTNTTNNLLEEYSLPNGKLLRTLTTKITGRFVIYKDKAYIFGASNVSSQQTILQKVQL